MAFLFTLLFVVVAYITPEVLFGVLAQYRVEVIFAFLAVATSVPNLARAKFSRSPEFWAFVVFCAFIPLSIASGGWVTGAIDAMYGFMPVVLCFMLPAANFRTRQHLQWLTLAMVLCSGYFIYNGLSDLQNHVSPSNFLYGEGELRRLRGLGFVFDPNDLGQVLVSLLPMVFLWKSKNWLLSILLVLPSIALLVTGMFFTHSRGAALALMATLIIALRRKLGTVPAVVLAGALFAASLAVGWSGGRDVSVEAGGDRLDAWSTGIMFIKQHPLFGLGAGRFADFNEITAHNSVVVCAAEIGLPGFLCWVFLIFSAVRSAISVGGWKPPETPSNGMEPSAALRVLPLRLARFAPSKLAVPAGGAALMPYMASLAVAAEGDAPVATSLSLRLPGTGGAGEETQVPDLELQKNIRGMARLLICSITGFLTAGWFLSRAFSMWLFLYIGVAYAIREMAEAAGMQPRRDSAGFLLRWSATIAISLLLLVYGVLKFRALTGH